jgi:hypothetical protein
MESDVEYGRPQGRAAFDQLVIAIESAGDCDVVRLSMKDVRHIDASFASEAIVELVRRFRGTKHICLVDLTDASIRFNIDLAADKAGVPIAIWSGDAVEMIGEKPSSGNHPALQFALGRRQVRTVEFAEEAKVSIANASTKFKQLWEQGFLKRTESAADTGGVEYVYERIC